MKPIYYAVLALVLCAQGASANWKSYLLSDNSNSRNESIASHQGKLYVVNEHNGLMVSNDDGVSYTQVKHSFEHTVTSLVSAGNRLYAVTIDDDDEFSEVLFSEDGGKNWESDMANLPVFNDVAASIRTMVSYNNGTQLVLNMIEGSGVYQKAVADEEWEKVNDLSEHGIHAFTHSNDTILACGLRAMYYSDNNGATWEMVGKSFPLVFDHVLKARGFDIENGNIYLGAHYIIEQEMKFLYSDDFGQSWKTLPIEKHLGKNNWGNFQKTIEIKVIGQKLWVSIDNDQRRSPQEMLHSTDNGQTFQKHDGGFETDLLGFDGIKKFITHNDQLVALSRYEYVYTQTVPQLLSTRNKHRQGTTIAYNQTTKEISLTDVNESYQLAVYSMDGRQVKPAVKWNGTPISMGDMKAGVYVVRVGRSAKKICVR